MEVSCQTEAWMISIRLYRSCIAFGHSLSFDEVVMLSVTSNNHTIKNGVYCSRWWLDGQAIWRQYHAQYHSYLISLPEFVACLS
ncbi:hypothetical protein M408DRAFT_98841 [Serendipita vermifera MAFF 305830]|uniref:Uncharacterized protein n=1 Tax=Serendipita vermifera MAFF 305830 TaxID=933852 RepID=A0A0C2WUP6_SERVB|nr:hypothetical protein M408DRAFT_98841 [Serendipita vermifera MAFF 305830]